MQTGVADGGRNIIVVPIQVDVDVSGAGAVYTQMDGAVASIVLNRPAKLNALTHQMIRAVRDEIVTAQRCPDVRVIVLRGEGRAFSVGDDLSDLSAAAGEAHKQRDLVAVLQDVTRQIMIGPKPVIAAVQGWAIGAAFSWVLNCDHAICARSTTAFFPELKWGVTPTGAATVLAPLMLGTALARSAFQSLRRFSATELVTLGAVSHVVDDGEELSAAMKTAADLAGRSPRALSAVKRLSNGLLLAHLEEVLANEAEVAALTASGDDVSERIHAFRERSKS